MKVPRSCGVIFHSSEARTPIWSPAPYLAVPGMTFEPRRKSTVPSWLSLMAAMRSATSSENGIFSMPCVCRWR